MYKIFKYPAGYEHGKLYAWMPEGKIIRSGWVEDNQYKGYWVWAIVDPEDKNFKKTFIDIKKEDVNLNKLSRIQLGILEEQSISVKSTLIKTEIMVLEGKIYLYYNETMTHEEELIKIVGYKTGQKIPYHPDNMFYLGCAPLVIKDEICIYFFGLAG